MRCVCVCMCGFNKYVESKYFLFTIFGYHHHKCGETDLFMVQKVFIEEKISHFTNGLLVLVKREESRVD